MVYGVPPAELNIIESGNLGSGKGDAQSKSFTYNTVMPLKEIILEKFNYRVIKKGLGIEDWMVDTRQADYPDDREISEIEDKGIRNGTLTINEARAARGRLPVKGGDEAVIVASRDILPVIRNAEIADEQRDAAQIDIETKKAQVEKIKNPPPPPVMVAPGQQPPNGKQLPQNGAKGQPPQLQKGNQQNAQQQQKETRQEALVQSIAESYESRASLGRAVWQAGVVSREPFQEHDCSESSSSTGLGGDNADTQAHNTPSQEDRDTQAQEAYDTQDSPYEAYREASRTPSAAAQEVTHWQDEDKDIQKQLAELKAKGIKFVTWKGHAGMCDECTPNDGKRVALGQRFPSGAMTVPEHNHCICEAKYE